MILFMSGSPSSIAAIAPVSPATTPAPTSTTAMSPVLTDSVPSSVPRSSLDNLIIWDNLSNLNATNCIYKMLNYKC